MQIEPKQPKLTEKVSVWRKALLDEATGPNVIAHDVMRLAEQWDEYRDEAGGVDCTTWLRTTLRPGLGVSFWQARVHAIETLGRAAITRIHHQVAVRVVRTVRDAAKREEVKMALLQGARSQHGTPLAPAQAYRVIAGIIGKRARKTECQRCARLEAALKQRGVAVPD